ncbi:vWA domain-containing protein [Paenibacillus sp. S02]|uniref:vWA domain-containing protein n=1 Tax=Paenibacillus sp. S02 TaxID=2823904 RepID=UPI0021ACA176|nr:vWA domain-containing protein [Paenibacillus sp. S02]
MFRIRKLGIIVFMTFVLFLQMGLNGVICTVNQANAASLGAVPIEGYDAVFVLDTSYSMRDTDPEGIAAEVINMFMDLSDADRTRVGFVAYNHNVVASKPLTSIAVAAQKSQIQQDIRTLNRSGYTDLGLGLRRGSELLAAGASQGRQPFMILLSDGETDFGASSGSRSKGDSNNDVSSVIKSAQTKGYPVYTIGLNHDGTVNRQELERIASQTGGASFITSSAEDLPEILNRIFASQIRSKLVPIAAITTTGEMQELTVTLPDSSMEEANLVLLSEHPLLETQLYSNSENVRRYKSSRYAILKIEHPQAGKVKLKLRGIRGDLVKINLLGSYRLEAEATMGGKQQATATHGDKPVQLLKGQATPFQAQLLLPDSQKLTDEAVYTSLQAHIIVTPKGGTAKKVPMTYKSGAFHTEYAFPQTGDYTWQLSLDSPQWYRKGTVHKVHAANAAPQVLKDLTIRLVKEDGDSRRSLSDFIIDPNHDKLNYKLDSEASGDAVNAEINGNDLLLSEPHTGDTQLKITATDPEGASSSATLTVSVQSRYTAIKWTVAISIVVAALLYWFLRPKPQFAGRIEGYFLATASGQEIPVKSWPLTSFPGRKVSLQELFRTLDVHEPLPEAERILFSAGKKGSLIVKHDTRCALQHGKIRLARNKKAVMEYSDKLYITFEDGVTEIELRYKAIKPNTSVYTDHIQAPTG